MRARHVPYFVALAFPLGCGDGVGHPIVERELTSPEAGGAAGWAVAGGAQRDDMRGRGGRGSIVDNGGRGIRPGEDEPWGGGQPDAACRGAEEWPAEIAYGELALLDVIDALRTQGFDCEMGGMGEPVAPLTMKAPLQCVARRHARDMAERGELDHVGADGVGPEDRIRRSGYEFRVAGEVIVREHASEVPLPVETLDALLAEGGSDCRNLVDPRFDSVGIGHFEDFWAIDLAGP